MEADATPTREKNDIEDKPLLTREWWTRTRMMFDHPHSNPKRAPHRPTDPQTNTWQEMECEDGEDEGGEDEDSSEGEAQVDYFVKETKNVRVHGNQLQFLIEWKDYPNEENYTWEEPTRGTCPMTRGKDGKIQG